MKKAFQTLHIQRLSSATLILSLALGCVVPATAAENQYVSPTPLTYTVAEGLRENDTTVFAGSEEAWEYAEKIESHVLDTVEEMKKIFAKQAVSIVDYGAEASIQFPNQPDTYKKTPEDTAKESELAVKNTRAIYKAIQAVSKSGGGTVVVPAAEGQVFYTAAIHLEDNVNLHLEKGAVLAFTTDTTLYEGDLVKELYYDADDPNCPVDEDGLVLNRFQSVEIMNYSPFIYAYGKKNIALTGEGTLDGQSTTGDGKNPETMYWHHWKSKRNFIVDGEKKKVEGQGASVTKVVGMGQLDIPVAQRKFGEPWKITKDENDAYIRSTTEKIQPYENTDLEDWLLATGFLRPNFIQPYNCQNVLIQGITMKNSPRWEINPTLCDTVLVDQVTVVSHLHNNDGCDPESTSNMVIQNSIFDVGDDCIAIKSGRNQDGLRIGRPSYNILIQNNKMIDGHGGVVIGSEITGNIKNIFSRNNDMESDELQAAYRLKTNYIRGGITENLYFKNDTVKMVQSDKAVVEVDLNYNAAKEINDMNEVTSEFKGYMPQFKNVLFEGMQVNTARIPGNGGQYTFQLKGFSKPEEEKLVNKDQLSDCYISGLTIRDCFFSGSDQIFDIKYVDGLTLENVVVEDGATASSVKNGKNIRLINCDFSRSNVDQSVFGSAAIVDDATKLYASPFTDIEKDYWAFPHITYVCNRGLLAGLSDNAFSPETASSRGEVLTALACASGMDLSDGADLYKKAVTWAKENDISDGTALEETVTREQLALMLYRCAGQPKTKTDALTEYGDAQQVSSWAAEAMSWAVEKGILIGKQDKLLDPAGTTSRAELAAVVHRFLPLAAK